MKHREVKIHSQSGLGKPLREAAGQMPPTAGEPERQRYQLAEQGLPKEQTEKKIDGPFR